MEYMKGITHCTFTCRNYPAMKHFYGEVLGLEQTFALAYNQQTIDGFTNSGYDTSGIRPGMEWITYWTVAPGEFIELFNLPYNGENNTEDEGFVQVTLVAEDLGDACRELLAKGQVLKVPGTGRILRGAEDLGEGISEVELTDPEGNHIRIAQTA